MRSRQATQRMLGNTVELQAEIIYPSHRFLAPSRFIATRGMIARQVGVVYLADAILRPGQCSPRDTKV